MRENTDEVNNSLEQIETIGREVDDRIHEIEGGAQNITSSMQHINTLNEQNDETTRSLTRSVERFKTADSEVAKSAEEAEEAPEAPSEALEEVAPPELGHDD